MHRAMKIDNFFAELKRRNVYKVAVAYAVVAWLTIQAASIFLPAFNAPQWVMQIVILILVVGFPIALAFSWAFEITPEGIVRESEVAADQSITHHTGRKLVALTIVLAVVATGLLIFQFVRPRTWPERQSNGSTSPSAATISNKSIAVLPFDNLSRDPDNAYFCEGVQDEILTRLAKVADLKVISRTSTQHFKSTPDNLPQIAKQLGVAHILEGSVQKASDQVRVNVQLINALTDAHLWAETYDRRLIDIFSVESEIAKNIAETLQAKITGSEKNSIAKAPTANPEAYELYLKGRHFWNRRTLADIQKALQLFQQAIEKDPNYAVAYAGLADSYSIMPNYSDDAPKQYIERAIPAARRAIELDDSLAEAHTAFGNVLGADLQLAAAEVEFKRAFALNPNYASAHQWYGECLQSLGRFDESIAEMRRAHELDPLSLIINSVLASAYYSAGRDEEAWQQIRRTFDLDPNFGVGFWVRAQLNERKGDLDQAIADYNKSGQTGVPLDQTSAMIACLYARSGRRGDAEKILHQLLNESRRRFVSSYALSQINATLGNKDEAVRLLEKAYDERTIPVGGGGNGGPKIDNRFDSLRSDPRFRKLVAKFVGESK
jgi:TolB-like protein/Tfp pilus assembly protein PilF